MQQPPSNRKGIYLLPNLFTTAGLFAGFYAIVAATQGRYTAAAIAVFIAMIMDGLDGRVARLTNTQSDFGAQLDSLVDMVAFGLAPALVMYEWSLANMHTLGWHWGKIGWLSAFIYVAAAALRLARFNIQSATFDKRFFQGLPSPAAAALMMGMVWVVDTLDYQGTQWLYSSLCLTLACGFLMVSRFTYYSFKDISGNRKVSFTAMSLVILLFVFVSFDPAKVLLLFFSLYALSGPVWGFWRRLRRWQRNRVQPHAE